MSLLRILSEEGKRVTGENKVRISIENISAEGGQTWVITGFLNIFTAMRKFI